MKRILMASDQPIFMLGISALLGVLQERSITVAHTNEELASLLNNNGYDVMIYGFTAMELNLVRETAVSNHALAILVFSGSSDVAKAKVHELYKAGIQGFLDLRSTIEEITQALGQVLENRTFISGVFLQYLLVGSHAEVSASPSSRLTHRELQVARLMLKGKKMSEIGLHLNLKPSTVTTFKKKIFHKLGISNMFELERKIGGIA